MRSFREFLLEYDSGSFYSNEELPDTDAPRDPSLAPIGGYTSSAQRASDRIELQRRDGPLKHVFEAQKKLEKFKNLAQQAAASINNRQRMQGQHSTQSDTYKSAAFHNNNKYVIILSESEILGGTFPRLRPEDLRWGIENQIFSPFNNNGQVYYYFYIKNLYQKIMEVRQLLQAASRDEERTRYRAGIADDAWNRGKDFVKGIVYGQSNLKIPGVTGL
jgi:hypothetical protein